MMPTTEREREAAFQRHLVSTVEYNAAIEAAGDLPWFRDPKKIAKLERHIPGITAMTEDERRRALFNRHHPGPRANGSAIAAKREESR